MYTGESMKVAKLPVTLIPISWAQAPSFLSLVVSFAALLLILSHQFPRFRYRPSLRKRLSVLGPLSPVPLAPSGVKAAQI